MAQCRVSIHSPLLEDCIFEGSSSSNYMKWDASANTLQTVGTGGLFRMGSSASTSGSGTALTSSNQYAMGVFADDGGAALGSGVLMRAGRFRTLLTYTGGNREQEVASVIGQVNSVGGTNRHNMCGVMGSYELSGSSALTIDGQAFATDPWIQAAVIGRVGVGTSKTTLNTNGRLCGLAAMSNTVSFTANNGVYTGVYVGKWTGEVDFGYGIYMDDAVSTAGIYLGAEATYGIQIAVPQTAGLYYVASFDGSEGAYVHGIKVELTRTADVQVASDTWFGAQFVLNLGSSGYTAPTHKVHALQAVVKGSDGKSTSTDYNVCRLETQSGGEVGNLLYITANTGTTVGDQMVYIASHVNVNKGIELNGATGTMTTGLRYVGTITNAFGFAATSGCGIAAKATSLNSLTSAYRIIVDINGTTGYIPVMTSWS